MANGIDVGGTLTAVDFIDLILNEAGLTARKAFEYRLTVIEDGMSPDIRFCSVREVRRDPSTRRCCVSLAPRNPTRTAGMTVNEFKTAWLNAGILPTDIVTFRRSDAGRTRQQVARVAVDNAHKSVNVYLG